MRNLKRVLALAMALVMILGMMVIGSSAASYSDESAIDAKYADAVEILSGMGVFKGTGAGFGPKQILDRASAAALVYRVITGDVNDKQVSLYDYSSFADVAEGVWYTPYITYAANGGYLKGFNGNAMPNDTVTGIQVLAMMLRAAGYGQNGEFEGAAWKDGILTVAKELGITAGISTNDLDKGATRELVAQLIFNAITGAKIVAYSPILNDYIPVTVSTKDNKVGFAVTQTLGEKVFGLTEVKNVCDHWGRPSTLWTNGKAYDVTTGKNIYAVIEATPIATYTTEVFECDVAKDLGLKAPVDAAVVLNGDDAAKVTIDLIFNASPAGKIGAQGRLTEIYNIGTAFAPVYKVVQVDQYLANVLDVTELEYDKNGHVSVPAKLMLKVHYAAGWEETVVLTSYVKNFTDYTPRATVLVYYDCDDANTAAHTDYVEYITNATSITGAQTAYTTKATHIVEGTEYPDAVQFNHDEAANNVTNYTWYFDTYGNLIGSFEVATKYSYGVISAIKWVEMDDLLEKGYALAAITYMDGTTENAKVVSINGTPLTSLNVEETLQNNAKWVRQDLYKIETTKKGLVLTETASTTAVVETGVPKMATGVHAGSATQFLVYNPGTLSYETYTGIKNVPSYEECTIWYAETGKPDSVAEYVYLSAFETSSFTDATFFWNTSLTIQTVLHPVYGGEYYWIISGGYVNGEKADIYTADADIVAALKNPARPTADKLYVLDIVDGFVYGMTQVPNNEAVYVKSLKAYAVYEGQLNNGTTNTTADDAVLAQGVLVVDGTSYDVEKAACITYNYDLAKTVAYDNDAYIYVIYTLNPAKVTEKVASLVYITDVANNTAAEEPGVAENLYAITVKGVAVDDEAYVDGKGTESDPYIYVADITNAVAAASRLNIVADDRDAVVEIHYSSFAGPNNATKIANGEYEDTSTNALTAGVSVFYVIVDGVYYEIHTEGVAADLVANGINTVADLQAFADAVAAGSTFVGETITLNADLNLAGIEWSPIGTASAPFNGTFDGNGKTISNLTVEGTKHVGLFGYIINAGTIKDLTVDGATVSGISHVGVIAGHMYGVIDGCTVKNATVECIDTVVDSDMDGDKAGAILGWLGEGAGSKVTDCTVDNVTITANRDAGCVVGLVYTDNIITGNTATNTSVEWSGYGSNANLSNTVVGRTQTAP